MTNSYNPRTICPLPEDSVDFDSKREIGLLYNIDQLGSIGDILSELLETESADEILSTLLDWANQLRIRDSLTWNEALIAAEIALIG